MERYSEFAGNLSDIYTNENEFTWPDYSTINITGDITVDSGKTLTINKNANINIPYCSDTTHGGFDSNKTEIKVLGNLRVSGSLSDTLTLTTNGASTGWRGIRTQGQGRVHLDYVAIKNADIGFEKYSNAIDTVSHTLFQNCQTHAIYSSGDNLRLVSCEIDSLRSAATAAIRFAYADNVTIIDCDIEKVYKAALLAHSSVEFDDCDFKSITPPMQWEGIGIDIDTSVQYSMPVSSLISTQEWTCAAPLYSLFRIAHFTDLPIQASIWSKESTVMIAA